MPGRGKRAADFDPTKSDSDDEDYDATSSRPPRTKPSKSQRSARHPKRKRRKSYDEDDGEELSGESEPSDDSFEAKDEPEPELDPRTGRPVRAARKARVTYEESDDNDDIEDLEPTPEPRPRQPSTTPKKKIITLKVGKQPEAIGLRSTRARSMSTKKPLTNDAPPQGTRRSSRINNDDETIIALTDSGKHADIVHQGTKSPEPLVQRAIKGGKGLKKPPASKAIVEEPEESSGQTKDEPTEELNEADYPQISPEPVPEISANVNILSKPDVGDEADETHGDAADDDEEEPGDTDVMVPESQDNSNKAVAAAEDEDLDDEPIATRSRRNKRKFEDEHGSPTGPAPKRTRGLTRASAARPTRSSQRGKKGVDDTSDFEPGNEEEAEDNVSDTDSHKSSPRKSQENEESSSSNNRRSARNKARAASQKRKASNGSENADEIAEELEDLQEPRAKRIRRQEILYDDKPQTRKRKPVDYRILRPDQALVMDDDDNDAGPSATPSKKARAGGGGTYGRSLFSTYGPFGGGGGPPPVLGGAVAAGGADSDSSDDENMLRPQNAPVTGGLVGMTPTSGAPPNFGLFTPAQTNDPSAQTGLVKRKAKAALTDADPLGTNVNVNFDSVGGLQGHIDKLKEMVALPLLYPEVFQRYKITPPRGVLFHGPPGTGEFLVV